MLAERHPPKDADADAFTIRLYYYLGMSAKDFLRPELPAEPPWQRCLYCSSFELWEGALPFCKARQQVLTLDAALSKRCNSWAPGETARKPSGWCPPVDEMAWLD